MVYKTAHLATQALVREHKSGLRFGMQHPISGLLRRRNTRTTTHQNPTTITLKSKNKTTQTARGKANKRAPDTSQEAARSHQLLTRPIVTPTLVAARCPPQPISPLSPFEMTPCFCLPHRYPPPSPSPLLHHSRNPSPRHRRRPCRPYRCRCRFRPLRKTVPGVSPATAPPHPTGSSPHTRHKRTTRTRWMDGCRGGRS